MFKWKEVLQVQAFEVIYNRFIVPCLNKQTGTIGVELEFPMLNMAKQPVDPSVAVELLQLFNQNGFRTVEWAADGTPAFVENEHGDVVSFDNSYNNIEFSMGHGDDLIAIKQRFHTLVGMAQTFLQSKHYLITGMGTNPYKQYITQSPVGFPVYRMVDAFLRTYANEQTHNTPDFPAYISSVQTHLDITPHDLPRTATLFAQIDFVRALLFANSPDFSGLGLLCGRDYYWEKSAFGLLGKNTGAADERYVTLQDIADSFLDRGMFHRLVEGEYRVFPPIRLKDYFEQPAFGATEKDIEQFLSFRNIELTCRGTLEVRGDCAQPISQAFAPPAFSLGLACNVEQAIDATQDFFSQHNITQTNSHLRAQAAAGQSVAGLSEGDLSRFATKLVEVADHGLRSRGKGEEPLLAPLYERAKTLTSPARNREKCLAAGQTLDDVILDYSRLS